MWVGLLGPLQVSDGGREVEVAGARLRALLCRLAVEPGRRVSAAELVDAVWSDDPPAEPANALQALVSRLRRALGRADLVVAGPSGYGLAVTAEQVDVGVFAGELAAAHWLVAADRLDAAYERLTAALQLWRGEPLVDAGDAGYAHGHRLRWQEQRLSAVKERAGLALRRGADAGLVAELEEACAEHPLDEPLLALLLRALAAAGRTSEALARYERARRFLADALGTDPGRALQQLHLDLLRGAPAADAEVVARTPLDGRVARSNLRSWLTSFVGRQGELDQVAALLTEHRLVTLVGPGGAGKTRLAAEAALRWLEEHDESAWLVELAPVTEAANIPAAILSGLGLRDARVLERADRPPQDTLDRLLDVLRDAGCLLVLDNCEHLVGAVAEVADQVLAAAPGVRMLTTSREPLALIGEALCPLPPLAVPPGRPTPEQAAEFAAVALWLDRARAARPDFVLDDQTLPPVLEIVRRLDGLPLAIELAAARLRVLPVAEIAARLSDRFRLLTGGHRTALPRHRTLRAVVEWSWDLLTPQERLLAERLAVFPAGADLATAVAVCADGAVPAAEVDTLLLSLVDKSLVQARHGADHLREAGSVGLRFRMLETIREYGIERLAERGELEAARTAHADFFTGLVAELEPLVRSADQLGALDRLDVDRENILAALRFLADSGRRHDALRLVLALLWYWQLLDSMSEAFAWLELVIDAGPDPDDPLLPYADAALAIARMASIGDQDGFGPEQDVDQVRAWEVARRDVAAICDRLVATPPAPYPPLEAMLPMIAMFADRPDLAGRFLDRTSSSPDPWLRASSRAGMANWADNDGDVARMRDALEEAYVLFQDLGDRWGLSTCLSLRARLATLEGRNADAIADYEEASAHVSKLGTSDDDLYIRIRLGELYTRIGDVDRARELLDDQRRHGHRPGGREMFAEAALCSLEWLAGDADGALVRVRELRRRLTDQGGAAPLMGHIRAVVLTASMAVENGAGDPATAEQDAVAGYPIVRGTRDMPMIAGYGLAVAGIAARRGQDRDAAEMLGAAAQVRGADDDADPMFQRISRALRERLADFDAAYAAGRTLTREQALDRLAPATLGLG